VPRGERKDHLARIQAKDTHLACNAALLQLANIVFPFRKPDLTLASIDRLPALFGT
jgi:hypothetical protein